MRKALTTLCLTLALASMLGVYAQAETSQSTENNKTSYILPGSDEINEPDSSNSETAETEAETTAQTVPAETAPADTAPADTAIAGTPAAEPAAPFAGDGELHIAFNGMISSAVIPIMIGDTTYVPFRAFCMSAISGAQISWNAETNESLCQSQGLVIEASFNQNYIIANGRVLYRNEPNISLNDKLYIPVRSLAAAIGAQIQWNESTLCVNLTLTGTPITSAEHFYNQADLLWLARIINAESKYEPLLGKIAVGNVILNRVADPDFPDTVYDVIFDCRYAVQFYPTSSPVMYNTPSEESIIAAKACLEGYTVSKNILYFMNPKLAVSTWISRNCNYLFAIGNHCFYA